MGEDIRLLLLGDHHSQGTIVSKNPSNKLEFLDSSTRGSAATRAQKREAERGRLQDSRSPYVGGASRQGGNSIAGADVVTKSDLNWDAPDEPFTSVNFATPRTRIVVRNSAPVDRWIRVRPTRLCEISARARRLRQHTSRNGTACFVFAGLADHHC